MHFYGVTCAFGVNHSGHGVLHPYERENAVQLVLGHFVLFGFTILGMSFAFFMSAILFCILFGSGNAVQFITALCYYVGYNFGRGVLYST